MIRSAPAPDGFAVGREHLVTASVIDNPVSANGIIGQIGTRDQKVAGLRPDGYTVLIFTSEQRFADSRTDVFLRAVLTHINDGDGEVHLPLMLQPFRSLFQNSHYSAAMIPTARSAARIVLVLRASPAIASLHSHSVIAGSVSEGVPPELSTRSVIGSPATNVVARL